jgi:hypothetical protein
MYKVQKNILNKIGDGSFIIITISSLLTSKDMAYTFDFFKHTGVTGTVNGSSFFLGIP